MTTPTPSPQPNAQPRFSCFKCDDGNTPLYCLNCAREGYVRAPAQPSLEGARKIAAERVARKIISEFQPPSADSELTEQDVPWLTDNILIAIALCDQTPPAPSLAPGSAGTPRTDHVAKIIGKLAARWKGGELGASSFIREADQAFYPLREMEKQLTALRGQVEELEKQLAVIGDIAVGNWDDATVGKVDAVLKEPTRYKDHVRAMFNAAQQLAAIQLERDDLKWSHDSYKSFREWAQEYLDAGRWGGHHLGDAIKTELLERDAQLTALAAERDETAASLVHWMATAQRRADKLLETTNNVESLRQQLEALRKEGEEHEAETEQLWKDLCGLNPKTGVAWLTPRMNREAAAIQKRWDDEDAARAAQQAEGKRGEEEV